ncbi:MAG: hypothetical protein GWM88_08720 [Pseudomonadales bacterium]|nr:phosphodiester glycosidase family protein [Pseudomonadales bacterium]NIX08083.1 hypothetical protein [Pseudomonadales bacterium]
MSRGVRFDVGLGAAIRIVVAILWAAFAGACDQKAGAEREVDAVVPSGSLELPARDLVAETIMAPSRFVELFSQLEEPGLRIHRVDVDGEVAMVLVEVDEQRFEPVLVGADGASRSGVTAVEALTDFGLDVVIGSSFVSEIHSLTPVGLLQIDGTVISDLQAHGYTRVLGVRQEGLGVVSSRAYHRGIFDSAVQAGPGVVEEGRLDISERDLKRPKYYRTFVGVCDGKALLGASQVPMNLHAVGKRLLEYLAEIGEQCDEVVNLAGDREVVLARLSPDRRRVTYFGHPFTAKAGLLGFRRREGN